MYFNDNMTNKIESDIEGEDLKVSPGFLKFMKAMEGHPSDVSAILNCHLVAEYFLDQIIHASLPRADVLLEGSRYTFSNKLLLVKALDVLSDQTVSSLKALNKVRNLCSHELDYKVTETNIDSIGRPFGKEYLEMKKEYANELLHYTLMTPLARLEGSYEDITENETVED
jgi:hypothetical protein